MTAGRGTRALRRLILACQIHLGRPVWAAALLLLAAVALLAHWLPQLQTQREQLRRTQHDQEDFLRALSARTAAPPDAPSAAAPTPLLPLPSQHQNDLGTLLELARGNGLSWQHADYTMELGGTFGTADNVLRLRLTLPVTGNALQVSRFLGSALNRLPNASVDSLEFERDDAATPTQSAKLRLVLLYRGSAQRP